MCACLLAYYSQHSSTSVFTAGILLGFLDFREGDNGEFQKMNGRVALFGFSYSFFDNRSRRFQEHNSEISRRLM